MRIGNAELPPDLLAPIFEHVPDQALSYNDISIRSCSEVCRLWRKESMPAMFRTVKLVLWHQSLPSTDNVKSFSDLVTVFPQLPTYVRELQIDATAVSLDQSIADSIAQYNKRMNKLFPILCSKFTRIYTLDIICGHLYDSRDAWFGVLGSTTRAAIRELCATPSVKSIRDGLGLPYSLWMNNTNIMDVTLRNKKISDNAAKREVSEIGGQNYLNQIPPSVRQLNILIDELERESTVHLHAASLANEYPQMLRGLRSLEFILEGQATSSHDARQPIQQLVTAASKSLSEFHLHCESGVDIDFTNNHALEVFSTHLYISDPSASASSEIFMRFPTFYPTSHTKLRSVSLLFEVPPPHHAPPHVLSNPAPPWIDSYIHKMEEKLIYLPRLTNFQELTVQIISHGVRTIRTFNEDDQGLLLQRLVPQLYSLASNVNQIGDATPNIPSSLKLGLSIVSTPQPGDTRTVISLKRIRLGTA